MADLSHYSLSAGLTEDFAVKKTGAGMASRPLNHKRKRSYFPDRTVSLGSLCALFLQPCRERRHELHDIGHHQDIRHLADGGVLILVDGNDKF